MHNAYIQTLKGQNIEDVKEKLVRLKFVYVQRFKRKSRQREEVKMKSA